MLTFLLLIVFLGTLFGFGWQLSRFVLNEKRIEALIPLSAITGSSIYLLLLNASSYFLKIQVNFYLIFVVLAFFAYVLFRLNKNKERAEWGISGKWRKILLATCILIMIPVGIIGLRNVDDKSLSHLPVAATIAEGNFPVKDLYAPEFLAQDHYAYNLFSAAIYKITGLPVWSGLDIQNFIFIGALFLLAFLLARDICKDNFKAYTASLITILGGNLSFIYGIEGLASSNTSFKFLSDMIFGRSARSGMVANHAEGEWVILGFALTIAVIHLYFKAVQDKKNWLSISLLTGFVFAFLALSAEIFFGALAIILLVYPMIFAIIKKEAAKEFLRVSLVILSLGSVIALFQGGILTQTAKQILFSSESPIDYSFSIALSNLFSNLSLSVFLAWGWMFIFIVPVTWHVLKKYFQPGLFIVLLILIPLLLSLIVVAEAGMWGGNFTRINYLTALFWNFSFGLFLGWLFLFFKKRWQRLLTAVLVSGVVFQGLFYFVASSIFPNMERGRPLLAQIKADSAQEQAIDWIKNNTTTKDYFFAAGPCNNTEFVALTGRFAPNYYFYGGTCARGNWSYEGINPALADKISGYGKILEECDSAALNKLNYRYLYVDGNWPEFLEQKCLTIGNLELKLEIKAQEESIRIYEIL